MSCKRSHSHTLCPLPWMSLSLNSDQSFRLCCHDTKQEKVTDDSDQVLSLKNTTSTQTVLNSRLYKNTRSLMLKGEIPSNCQGCFDLEREGITSPREDYLNQFHDLPAYEQTEDDGTLIKTGEIHYLEAVTDNHCNLKCRMCHPQYSASLEKDWKKLKIPLKESYQNRNDSLSQSPMIQEILPQLKALTVTGGEPLHSRPSRDLVREASKQGKDDLSLRYYTNGTVRPSHELLKSWVKFKSITIYLSLDGTGKTQEYIRFPSNWDKLKTNIDFFMELQKEKSHIEIKVHTVLQAYNILNIDDLLQYLYQYRYQIPFVPSFTPIDTPSLFKINVLPKKVLQKGKEKIEKTWETLPIDDIPPHLREETQNNYTALLECINEAMKNQRPDDYFSFMVLTKKWDELRGQDFRDVIYE